LLFAIAFHAYIGGSMSSSAPHICHLSLLNPAIHSRIFFKMALSQVHAGYRVSIIAQDAAAHPYMREGVQIVPIGVFGRMSWRRRSSVGKVRRLAMSLQADIYQVHTVELLPMAHKLKRLLPGSRVLFDMHEDYIGNIRFGDYYGVWVKPMLLRRVGAILGDYPRWGDGLILAEDCFAGLVDFDADRTMVVRNKYKAPWAVQGAATGTAATRLATLGAATADSHQVENEPHPTTVVGAKGAGEAPVSTSSDLAAMTLRGMPYILHSGTIAENWGIFKAVELWERLNRLQPIGLVVAGHGQDRELLAELSLRVASTGFQDRFLLAGGADYLPFEEVVKYIQGCTFGLALYAPKENIKDRIPTKFYEFMAHQKPLIFSENPAWDALNGRFPFGMSITWPLDQEAISKMEGIIQEGAIACCPQPVPEAVWSWDYEAQSMLQLISKLVPLS
jgi:glycosyltransferase involved in cell wall biosynthesis